MGLRTLHSDGSQAWLVCGDLNEIMDPDKKLGVKDRSDKKINYFKKVLDNCALETWVIEVLNSHGVIIGKVSLV